MDEQKYFDNAGNELSKEEYTEYIDMRKSAFDENYKSVLQRMSNACNSFGGKMSDVTLLAASKTVEAEVINHAYESGIEYMGENRVQEFLSKNEFVSPKMHRHLIGTLQCNKVRQIVGKVEMIQSVDSIKLAKEIDKRSKMLDIVTNILVEVNIGSEEQKSGVMPEMLDDLLAEISQFDNISVKGLMTLGPVGQIVQKKHEIFDKMQKIFIDKSTKKVDNISMDILSMGMSDDFDIAIEHGANMVRVGSALFGHRIYK